MEWLSLTLQTVACLAGCLAGWGAGRRGQTASLTALGVAIAFIGLRVLFRFFPECELPLLSSGLYATIQPYGLFPFAFLVLGVAFARTKRINRLALSAGALALFVLALCRPWAMATFNRSEFIGMPGPDGVCLQTQDFTCGAAASATLLTSLGIPSDEAEMAYLCRSAPLTGTDEMDICRGLRRKLSDGRFMVVVERPNVDSLFRHTHPVLVRVRATALRDHWVALLAINDRSAILGDPLQGRVTVPVDTFLSQWRGHLIRVERASTLLALR